MAFGRNGLAETPNTPHVNHKALIAGFSFLDVINPEEVEASWSDPVMDTCRKAFSR